MITFEGGSAAGDGAVCDDVKRPLKTNEGKTNSETRRSWRGVGFHPSRCVRSSGFSAAKHTDARCEGTNCRAVQNATLPRSPGFSLEAAKVEAGTIAREIDSLIPGEPPGLGTTPVFISDVENNPAVPQPITVEGERKFFEPPIAVLFPIRVYLVNVMPPGTFYGARLAFQLGHELGHVKMGRNPDSYLQETFAVGVSFEVLRSVGAYSYLNDSLRASAERVPELLPLLKTSPSQTDLDAASQAWQRAVDRWLKSDTPWDYDTMALGVLLMESGCSRQFIWPQLIGMSTLSLPPPLKREGGFVIEAPDVDALSQRIPALCRLGYPCGRIPSCK